MGNNVYILLEFASKNAVFFYIHPSAGISENLALRFLYQTALAVKYLHDRGFIHRDIKPENLLLDDKFEVKLCDFGWSCKLMSDDDYRTSICGTYEYMSPEIVLLPQHNRKVDIWCLGILMIEMITGMPPFKAENLKDLRAQFSNKSIPIPQTLSAKTQELMRGMLQVQDEKRYTVDQVLNHPALAGGKAEFFKPLSQQEHNTLMKNYFLNTQKKSYSLIRELESLIYRGPYREELNVPKPNLPSALNRQYFPETQNKNPPEAKPAAVPQQAQPQPQIKPNPQPISKPQEVQQTVKPIANSNLNQPVQSIPEQNPIQKNQFQQATSTFQSSAQQTPTKPFSGAKIKLNLNGEQINSIPIFDPKPNRISDLNTYNNPAPPPAVPPPQPQKIEQPSTYQSKFTSYNQLSASQPQNFQQSNAKSTQVQSFSSQFQNLNLSAQGYSSQPQAIQAQAPAPISTTAPPYVSSQTSNYQSSNQALLTQTQAKPIPTSLNISLNSKLKTIDQPQFNRAPLTDRFADSSIASQNSNFISTIRQKSPATKRVITIENPTNFSSNMNFLSNPEKRVVLSDALSSKLSNSTFQPPSAQKQGLPTSFSIDYIQPPTFLKTVNTQSAADLTVKKFGGTTHFGELARSNGKQEGTNNSVSLAGEENFKKKVKIDLKSFMDFNGLQIKN